MNENRSSREILKFEIADDCPKIIAFSDLKITITSSPNYAERAMFVKIIHRSDKLEITALFDVKVIEGMSQFAVASSMFEGFGFTLTDDRVSPGLMKSPETIAAKAEIKRLSSPAINSPWIVTRRAVPDPEYPMLAFLGDIDGRAFGFVCLHRESVNLTDNEIIILILNDHCQKASLAPPKERTIVTAADIIEAFKAMNHTERAEIRRLLGIANDYRREEISTGPLGRAPSSESPKGGQS